MRWISLLLLLFFFSCKSRTDAPDVSGVKIDVNVQRFEKDFFALDTAHLQESLQALERKYPSFLTEYFKYFAPLGEMARARGRSFEEELRDYLRNVRPMAADVEKRFASVNDLESGLEDYLRYVKHYFPSFKTPAVLTSVEGLNPENAAEIYGTTYFNDTLVVSLQMFLGKDYPAYDPQFYPDYLRRRLQPAYMVPNCLRSIAGELYRDTSESSSLIEQMIEKGKQWWLLKKFMPGVADSLVTGYTAQQMTDLEREEGNVWGVISQHENLFSIESSTIQTYIGEAPFTQTLPQGAPGNIGPWIGWRIINRFEAENPKLTVPQILRTTAKRIFEGAKYRPK